MAELVLYTHPWSRGRTARWMLEEVGQPYRAEVLDYATTMKAPAYLAINPMGKVPALVHGDIVVTETAAICAYLADAFPQAGLAPAIGDPARAAYYRWMFFMAGPFEAAATNASMGFVAAEERAATLGYGTLQRVVDALDGALTGREYVAGDRFTAADVFTGAQLGWMLQFGMIEKRPAFVDYAGRMAARPAAARARQIDEDLAAALNPGQG